MKTNTPPTDTPEFRLNAATPCGVVRDGHTMTMVRLDDLQSLCGAVVIFEREGKAAREANLILSTQNAKLDEKVQALTDVIVKAIEILSRQ